MEIRTYTKNFFKEPQDIQRAITFAINDLYRRIAIYEHQNISFDRIFNDDHVKYDKHGDCFTFKFQHSNLQLRILYLYMIVENSPTITIVDYFIKKKNNKKYIRRFEAVQNMDPADIYKNSKIVESNCIC